MSRGELACQLSSCTPVLHVMILGLLQVVNGMMAQSQQRGASEAPVTALGVLPLVRNHRLWCSRREAAAASMHDHLHSQGRQGFCDAYPVLEMQGMPFCSGSTCGSLVLSYWFCIVPGTTRHAKHATAER
jgi:hypothetical protein